MTRCGLRFTHWLAGGTLLASAMLVGAALPAQAATAGELAQLCADIEVATYPTGRCVGYMEGVLDVLWERRATMQNTLFCLPATATKRDVFQAVISFAQENQDKADTPAHIIIEYALRVKFPCK